METFREIGETVGLLLYGRLRKGFVVLDVPRELLQFALHGYEINERGHGFLHDALRVRALDVLREVPNAQRAVARYNATRGLQRPVDYVE